MKTWNNVTVWDLAEWSEVALYAPNPVLLTVQRLDRKTYISTAKFKNLGAIEMIWERKGKAKETQTLQAYFFDKEEKYNFNTFADAWDFMANAVNNKKV